MEKGRAERKERRLYGEEDALIDNECGGSMSVHTHDGVVGGQTMALTPRSSLFCHSEAVFSATPALSSATVMEKTLASLHFICVLSASSRFSVTNLVSSSTTFRPCLPTAENTRPIIITARKGRRLTFYDFLLKLVGERLLP